MALGRKFKVAFTDFWSGFEKNNFLLRVLEKEFELEISNTPDYLFYSVYGEEHLNYKNCIKICYTGENMVPDFNQCDYALGFHFIDFEDRYLRYPLYLIYPAYSSIKDKALPPNNFLVKRQFCNFIYSNNSNADPLREAFYHSLSDYKKVDSGGRFLNNIGKPIINKLEFISNYKFTIAFENSSVNGYTTEKLIEPMAVNSMPIYYGNPKVKNDFNTNSFIHINEFANINEAIEEIIELDTNDIAYIEKMNNSWMLDTQKFSDLEGKLLNFISYIFNQPISEAGRIASYGYNMHASKINKMKADLYKKKVRVNERKFRVRKIVNRFRG